MKYIWMKVDINNNEEPLAVAGSQRELAKILGIKEESIRQQRSRAKRLGQRCSYVKVEDNEDGDD